MLDKIKKYRLFNFLKISDEACHNYDVFLDTYFLKNKKNKNFFIKIALKLYLRSNNAFYWHNS